MKRISRLGLVAAAVLAAAACSVRAETSLPGDPDLALAAELRTQVLELMSARKFAEAEQLAQQRLDIIERKRGPDHALVAAALEMLGDVYRAQTRYADAEAVYRRAVEIAQKTFGDGGLATFLDRLAVIYLVQGRDAEAEALFKRTLAIYENIPRLGDDSAIEVLQILAALYHRQGRDAEAEAMEQRVLAIRKKYAPPKPEIAL